MTVPVHPERSEAESKGAFAPPSTLGLRPDAQGERGVRDPWLERATDRINPIIVKEVRQGLRTKAFWIFFALMLLACLVISLIAFAAQAADDFASSGQYFFFAYFFCLGVVHFFVIPYSAYRSLAREREDETWVLLTLTGLGPRRILLGKLGSFVTQAALYGSAAGPFLLFSYYLNGIDLPTILVVLALGGAFQAFLTSVSVCAATLAEQRLGRGLVHFALLGLLLFSVMNGLTLAFALVSGGRGIINDSAFAIGLAAGLWAMLSYGALLFEAAAARLSLATESYARGVRLVFVLQLAGSAAILLCAWFSSGRASIPAEIGQAVFCFHLGVAGLFVATDTDGMARRHRSGTRFFSLFRPGALRGFRLVMLCLVLSTALWAALYLFSGGDLRDTEFFMIGAEAAYVALYLSAPLLLSRLLPFGFRTSAAARLLFVALLVVGSGLTPLAGAIVDGDASVGPFDLINPVMGLAAFDDAKLFGPELLVLAATAFAVTAAADRVLAWRDRPQP